MPGLVGVEVEGLAELQRALRELPGGIQQALKRGLIQGAEPIRTRAEALAAAEISGMSRQVTAHWQGMRVGTQGPLVYLAPASRGARHQPRRRPNLGGLLLGKAMEPALVQGEDRLSAAVEREIDKAVAAAGF